jgi:hypothetical protein
MLQGKLGPRNQLQDCGLSAQVKAPSPVVQKAVTDNGDH